MGRFVIRNVVINLTGGFEMALDLYLVCSIRIPENYDFTDGITVFIQQSRVAGW